MNAAVEPPGDGADRSLCSVFSGAEILRSNDHALSDDEEVVGELFRGFFADQCPIERVRDAEPLGFDPSLWTRLHEIGAVGMAVPEASGGGGGGLVALALAAEEHGRRLAPVPFVECAVTARLLACHTACSPAARSRLDAALTGNDLVTLALGSGSARGEQLVVAAPIADAVVGLDGDELVVVQVTEPPEMLPNVGRVPLGRVSLSNRDRTVLASGTAASGSFARAVHEWRLGTASALVGMAHEALHVATAHACERRQFGVPIGTFQAVAHPLADAAIGVETGRRLVRKAAWYADHEDSPTRATAAFLFASELAVRTAQTAMHTLGGVGVTESDLPMYLRRAKAWAVLAGDPRDQLLALADDLFGPVRGPVRGAAA